ncbi:hypothetical protein [Chryseobacterium sp. RLHN22]|uniref:hypothetical protein n=1 Tax=Chryseobacterium sp. RLHN22 TaxID=3437885 RepID=UPI003D9AD018
MNNLLTILILILIIQSCENKTEKTIEKSHQEKTEKEWTKEEVRELTGSLYAKFDDDDIDEDFNIIKNNDDIVQSVLSVSLSSEKKDVEINLLNNSVLYNNNESYYYTFFNVDNKKVCTVTIEYAEQETIPAISGEKKNLTEKIKYRFNNQNRKIQVIGYELSYQKASKFITKSFNFITGKFIVTRKENGKTSNENGWAEELENIYVEDWTFPFLRDKIFWYGNGAE